jgi:hypothetical protein
MITAQSIATQWLNGKHVKPTTAERKAFGVWLMREFNRMRASGIEPLFVTRDVPIEEAMNALNRTVLPGEIRWLPISRLNNEPNVDLMSTQQNLMFRAIHDWVHWKENAGADWDGELAVTVAHVLTAPKEIHWILWSEVAGQAAVTLTTGSFPQQKLVKI